MKKNNDGIIPVTRFIREYLAYKKAADKRVRDCYDKFGLLDSEYHIFEHNCSIVIEQWHDMNDMLHQREYLNKDLFLRDIAKKLDKSLVWVYQELVLSGFGDDIPMDSDIYQVSLLAYDDTYSFLSNSSDKNITSFEDDVILTGDRYEVMLNNRLKKIKRSKIISMK